VRLEVIVRVDARAPLSAAAAAVLIAMVAATSQPYVYWAVADQAALWILVPLDDEGVHAGVLEIEVRPPPPRIVEQGARDELSDPELHPRWPTDFTVRVQLSNPDARRSLAVVGSEPGDRRRVADEVLLEASLWDCEPDVVCRRELRVAFEGRRDARDPVRVAVTLGANISDYATLDPLHRPSMSVAWHADGAPVGDEWAEDR
jgi:hypothetical protein